MNILLGRDLDSPDHAGNGKIRSTYRCKEGALARKAGRHAVAAGHLKVVAEHLSSLSLPGLSKPTPQPPGLAYFRQR